MKLLIFGCLAGTGPRPGHNQTALAFEKDGFLHYFEAGENCSRTMYFMGRRAEQIKRIFISRFHLDHFCGLMGLLGTLPPQEDELRKIEIFTPEPGIFPLLHELVKRTSDGCRGWDFEEHPLERETFSEMDGVKVQWRSDDCAGSGKKDLLRSWAFKIEAEGKSIVYSGDISSPDELGEWLRDPDVLLMESEHHSIPDLCRKFKHEKRKIGKLIFIHHGCELLEHREEIWNRARDIWDGELYFAEDGQVFEL